MNIHFSGRTDSNEPLTMILRRHRMPQAQRHEQQLHITQTRHWDRLLSRWALPSI